MSEGGPNKGIPHIWEVNPEFVPGVSPIETYWKNGDYIPVISGGLEFDTKKEALDWTLRQYPATIEVKTNDGNIIATIKVYDGASKLQLIKQEINMNHDRNPSAPKPYKVKVENWPIGIPCPYNGLMFNPY